MMISGRLTIIERIPIWKERSTTNERGCWLFQGWLTDGYAAVGYKGKLYKLHVLVWEHFNGPVPDGFELDHLCRNRNCWNPGADHLEAVTHQVNCQRGDVGKHEACKTKCPKGHEFTPENTYNDPRGYRGCLTCRRQSVKASRERAASKVL